MACSVLSDMCNLTRCVTTLRHFLYVARRLATEKGEVLEENQIRVVSRKAATGYWRKRTDNAGRGGTCGQTPNSPGGRGKTSFNFMFCSLISLCVRGVRVESGAKS